MLKKSLSILISVLIIITFYFSSFANVKNRDGGYLGENMIQPFWQEITEFRNNFNISSTGKATVTVILYAYDVDSIEVEANLQQYKNGSWVTIKSWSNSSNDYYCGIGESWYVMSGYNYRLYSIGTVYENEVPVEQTTYTSDPHWY